MRRPRRKASSEPVDFFSLLPDRSTLTTFVPCPTPGCADGWVYGPRGVVPCPKCRAGQAEVGAPARTALGLAQAGIERTLYDKTWEDIRIRHRSWQLARELGRNIEDLIGENINVAMIGPKGRGKSQAMTLLVRDAIQAGHSGLVISWADWVDEVQSDYTRKARTQAEHVADLVRPAVLGLDEVGGAASRDGALERKLFTRVIGARYNARRPTILTGNLTRAQLEEAMGDRAFDRIQHACEWIVFDGPSERAETDRTRVEATLARIRAAAGVAS